MASAGEYRGLFARIVARVQSVADALRAVLGHVPKLASEIVPLGGARGRVLVADVTAGRPSPGFDNSAMDGYAARATDLPGRLRLVGASVAGGAFAGEVAAGTCVRILTGAPVPPGATTVVMQEDARVDGDHVVLPAAPVGAHVRRRGEDIAVGEPVLAAGTRLTAWHLGVLAAMGCARIEVTRAPRVALIATGDELVEVDVEPGPGQLVDSSAWALAGVIEEAGGIPTRLGIAKDELSALRPLIAAALEYDAIITTGGVSVGDRDHVHAALADAGIQLALWKVAMKPGKPFSFAARGRVPIFGLPGNPVSTLVAAELFVRPALLAMQGALVVERPRAWAVLSERYAKQPGRAHYLRAHVARDGERLVATPHAKQGSAMLSSLIGSNGLVELAAELGDVAAGTAVPVILLEAV